MPEIESDNNHDVTNEEDPDTSTVSAHDEDESHDPFFKPIIQLPEVDVKSGEEDEEVLFQLRSKLYRYVAHVDSDDPPEWKERGTGDIKILKHQETGAIRILMRRDKTLKICANHFVAPWMILKPNCGSDRAFVWRVKDEFADGEAKPEVLAIKFSNESNANKFKTAFEDAVRQVTAFEAAKIKQEELDQEKGDEEKLSKMVEKVDLTQR